MTNVVCLSYYDLLISALESKVYNLTRFNEVTVYENTC